MLLPAVHGFIAYSACSYVNVEITFGSACL
jgi:hypothetical protein